MDSRDAVFEQLRGLVAKRKKARGRKKSRRGAQPGHERQLREPLPPERVDETIEYEIEDGEVQRLGLPPTGDFGVIHCYVRGRVWSDGPLPQETFQRLEAVAHVQVPP